MFGVVWLLSGYGALALAQGNAPLPKGGSAPAKEASGAGEKKVAENAIEQALRQKRYRTAYHLATRFLTKHPNDLNAIYLLAYTQKQVHFLRKAIRTVDRGLHIAPENVDLLILKAEIRIRQGRLEEARAILEPLKVAHPDNETVSQDLLKTYFPGGRETLMPPMDQHVFSLGLLQAPFVSDSFLVYTLPRWSLGIDAMGLNYTGGTAFVGDAQIATPLAGGKVRFLAGHTEYMGFATGQPSGTNGWTYGGIDARLTDSLDILVEAGNTYLARAGIYGHLFYTTSRFSFDVQGMDNMIWGDFGQSIILNGFESGVMGSASLQLTRRLTAGVNYWYFEYLLNNGNLPYGDLNNTFGYLDYLLAPDPDIDFLVGYDDWTILANPAAVSLVPEILRQQYVLAAFNIMKNFDSGVGLNAQLGGYEDFYNHLASYELAGGFRVPVSEHWSIYGNAVYFNESTLYSGPSEEVMLGLKILF
jgi:hypothetical protein